MKKLAVLMLALAVCMSLCACGGSEEAVPAETENVTEAATEAATEEVTEAPTEPTKIYHFGEPIETEMFMITPSFDGFAEELGNWPDENFLTPDGKISGGNPFKADEEKVMMYFSAVVEYVGDSKQNETVAIGGSVDFDNGYIFPLDSYDCGFTVDMDDVDWKYSNIMSFEPLSSKTTRYFRFCFEVPTQLETETDKPLVVKLGVNGAEYIYEIR